MAAEPVMKYAVILPTNINAPKASEIRMAKRMARTSPCSRVEAIGVIAVEADSGCVNSSMVPGSPKGCGPAYISTKRWDGDVTTLTDEHKSVREVLWMRYSIMVGTTDQLTAAIPGSIDKRVTICSTVSCFGPEVITSARTVVRSVPSMSSLRIDCKPTADWVMVVRSSVRM